jgi:hypothetical protein
MATEPQTLARYQKSNGYISGRVAATSPPPRHDLAASNPAVRTAFERAGLLPLSESLARADPPRPAPVPEAAGHDPWDATIAAVCAEKGLEPRGGLAHASGVSPGAAAHLSREARPTTPGALPWSVVVERVNAEAGFGPRAAAPTQTSPRGAPLAPSFAAPDAGRASTGEGAAPWGSVVARLNEEAGLTDKARGFAKRI